MRASIFRVGLGNVAGLVITAASIPILARLFDPHAFGVLAVAHTAFAILANVGTLRYETAMLLPSEDIVATRLAVAGLSSLLAVSVVGGILTAACTPWLGPDFFEGGGLFWGCVVFTGTLGGGIFQVVTAWLNREGSYGRYGLATFWLAVATVLCPLLAALFGTKGPGSLAVAVVVGQGGVALGLLLGMLMKNPAFFREASHPARVLQAACDYSAYPLFMTPYGLVAILRNRAVYPIFSFFQAVPAAGLFSLANRILNLPNSILSNAIRPVLYRESGGVGIRNLESLILLVVRSLGEVGVLISVPLLIHAETLVGLVLGTAWLPMVPYLQLLAPPAILLIMGDFADRLFDRLGHQKTALRLEMIFAALSIGLLAVTFGVTKEARLATAAHAAAQSVYYLVWLMVLFRISGFSLAALGRIILIVAAWAGGAAGICLLAASLVSPLWAAALSIAPCFCAAAWILIRRNILQLPRAGVAAPGHGKP
jgi:O-antigen/teichoic acid export membrane protein